MAKRQRVMLGARVDSELAEKVEEFREKLARRTPGIKVSTSDAVRVLIEKGVAEEP